MSREYALDPMEVTFAREVMRTDIIALPEDLSIKELSLADSDGSRPAGAAYLSGRG